MAFNTPVTNRENGIKKNNKTSKIFGTRGHEDNMTTHVQNQKKTNIIQEKLQMFLTSKILSKKNYTNHRFV